MWIRTLRDLKNALDTVPEKDLDCELMGDAMEDGGGTTTYDIWIDKEVYCGGEWVYQISLALDEDSKKYFDEGWEWGAKPFDEDE
jgi:hypothetical protein